MLQTTVYRGKKKRWNDTVLRLETRQLFELCESVTVHRTVRSDCSPDGSMLFSHGMVLHLKRSIEVNGLRVSRLDRTVQFGFKNLDYDTCTSKCRKKLRRRGIDAVYVGVELLYKHNGTTHGFLTERFPSSSPNDIG